MQSRRDARLVEERGIGMYIMYTNTISVEDFNFLHEAVGWGVSNPERVQKALNRSDFVISAQINGKAIGMARLIHDGLQVLLVDVIVLPEYQGQGIGKSIMNYVMEYLYALSKDGGIKVNLVTAPDKPGFYEKFGFIRRPTDQLGPGMTQWIEKKEVIL